MSGRRLGELTPELTPAVAPCVGAAGPPPSYLEPSSLNHFMWGELFGAAAILLGVVAAGVILFKLLQLLLRRCSSSGSGRTPRTAPADDYDPFPATTFQPTCAEALNAESKSRELV